MAGSALGSGATAQSFADFLVDNMNPVQEVFTTKVAGIRVKSRIFRIFGGRPSADALTHLTNYGSSIADSIEILPSWYSREEFVTTLSSGAHKILEDNPGFARALQRVEGESGINDPDRARNVSEAFEVLTKYLESSYLGRRDTFASLQLDSDMPDSYFDLLDEAERTNLWRMKLLKARMSHLQRELALGGSRGFAMFKRTVEAAQMELVPMTSFGKEVGKSSLTLELYATFANAENVKQVFEDRPFFREKIDERYYSKLEQSLSLSLSRLHRSLSALLAGNHLLLLDAQELTDLPISDSTREFQDAIARTILVSG